MIQLAINTDWPSLNTKWSKSATDEIRRALGEIMAMQTVIARHIRQRVIQGITVNQPKPYNNKVLEHKRFMSAYIEWRNTHDGDMSEFKRTAWQTPRKRYRIGTAYAQALGLSASNFVNSEEMHRIAGISGAPRGFATGGMWRGLQVRNFGSDKAMIDFGGSSVGAATGGLKNWRHGRSKDIGKPGWEKRRQGLVRNDEKAGTVYVNSNIGLLEMTTGEIEALEAAWLNQAGYVVQRTFGMNREKFRSSVGDSRLFAKLEAALTAPRMFLGRGTL